MTVHVEGSDDAVSIVDDYDRCQLSTLQRPLFMLRTFSAATNSTTNPHARVQVQVPRVTSLHVDVESERVGFGVDFICLSRVIKLLQGVSRPNAPSFIPNRDVCGRVVMCLK